MANETPDRKVNTDAKIENDNVKRMPHERDESPDGQDTAPRGVMKQAAADVASGMVDTDLHGKPGVAGAVDTDSAAGAQAKPQNDAADGMRHNEGTREGDSATIGNDNNNNTKGNTP